jgi:hypothetical protein
METVFITNDISDYVEKKCSTNFMALAIAKMEYLTKSQKRNTLVINTILNELKNNTNNILLVCDNILQMKLFNDAIRESQCIRIPEYSRTVLEEKTRVFICLNQPQFLFYPGDVLDKGILKKFNIKTCIYASVKKNIKWDFLEKHNFTKFIHIIDKEEDIEDNLCLSMQNSIVI